jgi:pyruvate/2-oxoglutarate dehydrogenase complex dihydrolipoamide acyltransferase (E2) component
MSTHWMSQSASTGGWGFGFLPMHTLGVTVGGIAEKPTLINGQLVLHEYLCITLSLDHDIVDGAPAARFARHFQELVEGGYGLDSN